MLSAVSAHNNQLITFKTKTSCTLVLALQFVELSLGQAIKLSADQLSQELRAFVLGFEASLLMRSGTARHMGRMFDLG